MHAIMNRLFSRKTFCVLFAACFCLLMLPSENVGGADDGTHTALARIRQLIDSYLSAPQETPAPDALKITDITAAIESSLSQVQTETGKRVCLLETVSRVPESETSVRNIYSAEYMLEVAGLPFFATPSLQEAMDSSSMIVVSSEVNRRTFTAAELDALREWVENGGVLVAPAVTAVNYDDEAGVAARTLFGVAGSEQSKARYRIEWSEEHYGDKELEYIDEEEERTTSLGQGKKLTGESIQTFGYVLQQDSGAERLAAFDDGSAAVVRRAAGRGRAYTFGYLWRDVVQRSQLNRDMEAQRTYANGFEPSADMTALFLRSAFACNRPLSVWKFTIPDGYESLIIPTHDCDSRTALDSMSYMSEYEKDLQLKAHYFITVHYFRDAPYMSAFYGDETIGNIRTLLAEGHTVGSHSLCHFPDFNVTSRFPMTIVTRDEYAATAHHEVGGVTTGGSTWAEVAMSKQILEEDLGNRVRSFRTGHLLMNENIPLAEQMAGYDFSSCFSAGDVLSEFPFRERIGRNWTGDFNGTLVMPLHISDVISSGSINENNWPEKVVMWHTVQGKLQGNYAPAILLIHPNRKWKMEAEKMLVEMTDRTKVGFWNFEDFGDFWNFRRELDFDYGYDAEASVLEIFLRNCDAETLPHLCFAVDLGEGVDDIKSVRLFNSNGKRIAGSKTKRLTGRRLLIRF